MLSLFQLALPRYPAVVSVGKHDGIRGEHIEGLIGLFKIKLHLGSRDLTEFEALKNRKCQIPHHEAHMDP